MVNKLPTFRKIVMP